MHTPADLEDSRASRESARAPVGNVLVVDDEPAIRQTLARYLERAGYRVRTAESVSQALEAIEERCFEVMLVDLRLPQGSGLDILAQVRTRAPDTRLILMSGSADVASAAAAVEQGIDGLVSKPFDLAAMRSRVDEAIARYRAAHSAMQQRELLEARIRQRDAESKLWVLRAAHALAHAVEAKDRYTAGHAQRVTGYALRIAEAAEGVDLDPLRLACNLHDVGKIGVPDAVLNKPSRLTQEESDLVRQHPETGWRILQPLIDDPLVIGVVRWHHERWDGTGYPDRLQGTEIPLPARIVAVADTLDAMTSSRSYRTALPWDCAVAEIRRGAGTQFDPDVVGMFNEVLPQLEGLFQAYGVRRRPAAAT